MIQTNFKINIKKEDGEKEVTVVIQELSPFIVSNIVMASMADNGQVMLGKFIENAIENEMIIQPKDLKKEIEEADNGLEIISEIYKELNEFCSNPRCYKLKKVEAERKKEDKGVESGDSEPNTDGTEKHE